MIALFPYASSNSSSHLLTFALFPPILNQFLTFFRIERLIKSNPFPCVPFAATLWQPQVFFCCWAALWTTCVESGPVAEFTLRMDCWVNCYVVGPSPKHCALFDNAIVNSMPNCTYCTGCVHCSCFGLSGPIVTFTALFTALCGPSVSDWHIFSANHSLLIDFITPSAFLFPPLPLFPSSHSRTIAFRRASAQEVLVSICEQFAADRRLQLFH